MLAKRWLRKWVAIAASTIFFFPEEPRKTKKKIRENNQTKLKIFATPSNNNKIKVATKTTHNKGKTDSQQHFQQQRQNENKLNVSIDSKGGIRN